jgi:hypothetical protein
VCNFRTTLIACAVLAVAATANAQQLVYRNTFRDVADLRWSHPVASQTSSGRSFLGPFTKEPVTFSLTDLPAHTRVTVAFNLFAIGGWAGSDAKGGPDIWEFGEAGGPRQVFSTFATTGKTQSYPAAYPQSVFSRGSWTFESNTLGYSADSVFHIQRTFTHSASELLLEFGSSGERWGLDNVEVWVTPTGLGANAWGYGALSASSATIWLSGSQYLVVSVASRTLSRWQVATSTASLCQPTAPSGAGATTALARP